MADLSDNSACTPYSNGVGIEGLPNSENVPFTNVVSLNPTTSFQPHPLFNQVKAISCQRGPRIEFVASHQLTAVNWNVVDPQHAVSHGDSTSDSADKVGQSSQDCDTADETTKPEVPVYQIGHATWSDDNQAIFNEFFEHFTSLPTECQEELLSNYFKSKNNALDAAHVAASTELCPGSNFAQFAEDESQLSPMTSTLFNASETLIAQHDPVSLDSFDFNASPCSSNAASFATFGQFATASLLDSLPIAAPKEQFVNFAAEKTGGMLQEASTCCAEIRNLSTPVAWQSIQVSIINPESRELLNQQFSVNEPAVCTPRSSPSTPQSVASTFTDVNTIVDRRRVDETAYYARLKAVWNEKVLPELILLWQCPYCVASGRNFRPTGIKKEVHKTSDNKDGVQPLSREQRARKGFLKHVKNFHVDEVCDSVYPNGIPQNTWLWKSAESMKKTKAKRTGVRK